MLLNGFQTLSNIRSESGVHKGDIPVVNVAAQELKMFTSIAKDEVIGHALVIFEKVLFDHIAFVTQAEDEVLVAVMRIVTSSHAKEWADIQSAPSVWAPPPSIRAYAYRIHHKTILLSYINRYNY